MRRCGALKKTAGAAARRLCDIEITPEQAWHYWTTQCRCRKLWTMAQRKPQLGQIEFDLAGDNYPSRPGAGRSARKRAAGAAAPSPGK